MGNTWVIKYKCELKYPTTLLFSSFFKQLWNGMLNNFRWCPKEIIVWMAALNLKMLTRFDARIWIFEESRDSLHHFSLLLHFSLNIIVIVVPIFKHPGPIFRIPLDHFTVAFLLWPFHSHDDLQRKIINKWIRNDE